VLNILGNTQHYYKKRNIKSCWKDI